MDNRSTLHVVCSNELTQVTWPNIWPHERIFCPNYFRKKSPPVDSPGPGSKFTGYLRPGFAWKKFPPLFSKKSSPPYFFRKKLGALFFYFFPKQPLLMQCHEICIYCMYQTPMNTLESLAHNFLIFKYGFFWKIKWWIFIILVKKSLRPLIFFENVFAPFFSKKVSLPYLFREKVLIPLFFWKNVFTPCRWSRPQKFFP